MKPAKKHSILPVVSSQLTATISVTLVLIVLGLVALAATAAHRATEAIKEEIGFVVIMSDDATASQLNAMKEHWEQSGYTSSVKYASADEVLRRWNQSMGLDPEEGDETLGGVNPFFPEFEVNLRAAYSHPDSVKRIADTARGLSGVREIKLNLENAAAVTSAVNRILWVLGIVAVALLVISFALINNTIRLTIYSRRFLIHTMRLVGATAGFIRKPFVRNSMLSGLISAAIAVAILGALTAWAMNAEPDLLQLVPAEAMVCVAAGMILTGVALCALAALFATNKYISLRYDEMFH